MSSPQAVSRSFNLPSDAILPKTASTLDLAAETSGDVLEAILKDQPFPNREIRLGGISLETGTAESVTLGVNEASVEFGASFRGTTGLAVLDSPEAVAEELGLAADTPLPLVDALGSGSLAHPRYVLFRAGYAARGEVDGSHPIGAFGTVGFGAAGETSRLFAVVHRIDPAHGAQTAVRSTIGAVRLPRQVRELSHLPPGTMLLVEANASLAFNLTAQLGYDFSFVRDLGDLGLQGDIGLRVESGLKAALGVTAGGRFLLAIDRSSSDESRTMVRVRLFKLRQKGWNFGLNMAVGVTASADVPDEADDFVKAVFGIHGQQIVRELHRIDEWTDPKEDLSRLVAGLATKQGLDLLKKTTRIDPRARFDEAREKLASALEFWDALPQGAAAATWKLLDDVLEDKPGRRKAVDALKLLVGDDAESRRAALASLMAGTDFESTPVGRFVERIADGGALALIDRVDLPDVLDSVIGVVDGRGPGDVIRRLHDYVENALDVEKLRTIGAADFDQVNEWLVARLASALGETLDSGNVESARATINRVVTLRREIYARAREAMNHRYDLSLTASWQKTTTRQVLLDAEFDLASESGRDLFTAMVARADYDRLLTTPDPAVRLHSATMSHEIERRSSIEVHMPFLDRKTTRLNQALANLRVEDDGERVLVYALDAKDEVTTVNRMRSSLSVTALMSVPLPGIRVHGRPSTTWSYSYRMARKDMRSGEVAETLRPLVDEYFPDHFPDNPDGSLEKWIADLDRAVEDATGNGTTEFGDVLLSLDLGLGGNAMAPWLEPRTREEARLGAKRVSISLQRQLKSLIPAYYFQDPDHLMDNRPASALIVWAALPPMTDMRVVHGKVVDRPESDGVHWNWPDADSRAAMVEDPRTLSRLTGLLRLYENRLRRCGREGQARRFELRHVQNFVDECGVREGAQFQSLLFTEAMLVDEARKALVDISGFWDNSTTAPSKALERLAEFGARITSTFNSRLGSLYGRGFLRPLGSSIFFEAARALDPELGTLQPDAVLVLKVLEEGSDYDMNAFLDNRPPDPSIVVLEQRLVNATG